MNDRQRTFTLTTIAQLIIVVVLIPFLPLLITRRWDWWAAWAYAFIYIGGFIISRMLVARRHPDLLAERARSLQHENVEPWDRVLSPLTALGGGIISLVAGLDVLFGWSSAYGGPVNIVALLLLVGGFALGTWAMLANPFFSGVVRIQHERDHRVVSGGPYRRLRHPGYTGALLSFLAIPLLLDSAWAFVPALLATAVLLIRTTLEDRFLHAQLPGYAAYADRVRYRLLPGVW